MSELHALTEGMQRRLWLPAEETRLWDPRTQGKLDTPLDSRGLVDLDELIALGKQTVEDGFDWSSPFNDVHHLQWPNAAYGDEEERLFRELTRRKAFLPRLFHNWLHHLTAPPALPEREVIHNSIEAEWTARNLAVTAQLAVRLTRMPAIPEAKLVERLEQEFDNYSLYIENAREVPLEFQLLKLAEVEARNVDEMLAANKRLGKLALHLIPNRFRQLQAT